MYLKKRLKNITIKQANIFTIVVVFIFSIGFVSLLVEDIYKDYEISLEQNIVSIENKSLTQELVSQKKEKLKNLLIKTVLMIVTLSFIIFAIAFGFYKIQNALIEQDIETFLDFFQSAAHREHVMIPNAIFFKDFRIMVNYINEMLETINEQKMTLKELNANLEDRVEEKTKNLQAMNQNLIHEKEFSQELLQSQKEFLRYTVHETNTPLSVILTSIELYEMKNKKDRQLSKIEAAVKNIFSIYDDLSYLVKKDQLKYPKTVHNLDYYVGSRIDFFQEVAEQSHVSFEYRADAKDAHIYFNETKLQRIVDNTITNAIKYTLPNELIYVVLVKDGAHISFSMGSKSKVIQNPDKVFDAFYREHETINDGFGIGLRLVQKICEEEQVDVKVESSEDITKFTYRFKMVGK